MHPAESRKVDSALPHPSYELHVQEFDSYNCPGFLIIDEETLLSLQ